jgi:uncharacterized protein YegP (UPF0339 family)
MMEYVHRDDELGEIDLTEDEIDAMMAVAEPVELVGPPRSAGTMRFELLASSANRYWWRLSLGEGRVLATSEVYPTKQAALEAVGAVRRAVAGADLVDQTAS